MISAARQLTRVSTELGVHDVICSVRRAQKVGVLGLPRAPLWRQEGTLEGLEAIIAIE